MQSLQADDHRVHSIALSEQRKCTSIYKSCIAFCFVLPGHDRADTTTEKEMGRLLAAAVVSAFVLSLAASAPMGTNANDTTVLNLAFVTSDTGEFVCNGKHL